MKILDTQNRELICGLTSTINNDGNFRASSPFDAIYAFSIVPDKNEVYRAEVKIKSGHYVPIDKLLSSTSTFIVLKPGVGSERVRLNLINNDTLVRTATFTTCFNYGFGKILDDRGATIYRNDSILIHRHPESSTYFVLISKESGAQGYELLDRFRNGEFESELSDFINLITGLDMIPEVQNVNEQVIGQE